MTPPNSEHPHRAAWLRTLALADPQALARQADAVLAEFAFETLRAPQTGLALVRARVAGGGERFNVGEATITRCVVRHVAPDAVAYAGVGHVMGSDARRAERVAQLDALLQRPDLNAALQRAVVQPLAAQLVAAHEQARTQAESSRVRFFTLQPEAGA